LITHNVHTAQQELVNVIYVELCHFDKWPSTSKWHCRMHLCTSKFLLWMCICFRFWVASTHTVHMRTVGQTDRREQCVRLSPG